MIQLLIILVGLSVAFGSGFKTAHTFFEVRAQKEKILFLEDQASKYKQSEEASKAIDTEGKTKDIEDETTTTNLTKELPKHDSPNRIILPDSWMSKLGRVR
jgi:hypothetical protein